MEVGFIPDVGYGAVLQLSWQRGEPEPRKFLGMSTGIKFNLGSELPITAARCTKCGLLKLYAIAPDDSR
jgi:hypothetical protein